jgi:hypothetical protein
VHSLVRTINKWLTRRGRHRKQELTPEQKLLAESFDFARASLARKYARVATWRKCPYEIRPALRTPHKYERQEQFLLQQSEDLISGRSDLVVNHC